MHIQIQRALNVPANMPQTSTAPPSAANMLEEDMSGPNMIPMAVGVTLGVIVFVTIIIIVFVLVRKR